VKFVVNKLREAYIEPVAVEVEEEHKLNKETDRKESEEKDTCEYIPLLVKKLAFYICLFIISISTHIVVYY